MLSREYEGYKGQSFVLLVNSFDMRTFELLTSGLMITKVKANNADEALRKFCNMTNEQRVNSTSIVDVNYYGEVEEII